MATFKPYANERDALTLGGLAIENRIDRISLHGEVELTRDKTGLELARHLQAVLVATVKALEAEPDLPDAVAVEPAVKVKNPFA